MISQVQRTKITNKLVNWYSGMNPNGRSVVLLEAGVERLQVVVPVPWSRPGRDQVRLSDALVGGVVGGVGGSVGGEKVAEQFIDNPYPSSGGSGSW